MHLLNQLPLRRMKILYYLCSLCMALPSTAQVNVDSLMAVWNDTNQPDTVRLKAIDIIAFQGYSSSQPDSAFYYAQLQYDYAQKHGHKKYMAKALNTQGVSFGYRANFEKAKELFIQALSIHEEIGSKVNMAAALGNIAVITAQQGDYATAIDYFMRELKLKEEIQDKNGMCSAYINIGIAYSNLDDEPNAIEFLDKGRVTAEGVGNKTGLATSVINLGAIFFEREQYDSALSYFNRSLTVFSEIGNIYGEVQALSNIGVIFKKRGHYSIAMEYYTRSLALAQKVDAKTQICTGLINISSVVKARGDSALMKGNVAVSKQNYNKAIDYAQKAMDIAQQIGDVQSISNAAKGLYELHQTTGKYKSALSMYELYITSRDSILSEENQKAVIHQQYQYDYEKRKIADDVAHRSALEKEANRRYALYIIVTLLALFAVFVYRAWKIRRKLSEELKVSYAKLKELNEYKESMTAMLNHDLRSPLTLIEGYAARIASNEQNYLTNETQEDLEHLKRNAEKLKSMSEEIQDLLLLKEGKLRLNFTELEINSYLKMLVKMFVSNADQSGITLSFKSYVTDDLLVRLDQQHFDKVIYNLVINAIRYTQEDGEIKVFLDHTNTHCEITITDTGRGISAKHLPLIFDRFYQSKDNHYQSTEGYGIGLAVVKELVELHGGEVSIESELNKGTSICILLPFNLDKDIQKQFDPQEKDLSPQLNALFKEAPTSMIGREENSTLPTVLVVDDHVEIRTYISDIIRTDYRVKNASDGKQALRILEKEEVDLIITDLMMPWLDGFELIELLKQNEQFNAIPIMVISARTSEEDRLKILDQGVNNFVSKPFNPHELKKRIHNMLNTHEDQVNSWNHIVSDKDLLSNVEQNILRKLNQIIIDHIDQPSLTIEFLANELSASRSKTIKMIKGLTGKTPLSYVKGIRMDYVAQLIKSKKIKNSSEAAHAIGMKNATQFSQQFQKHYGERPF